MSSPTSGSEPSSAFEALHPRLQRWIHQQGWSTLHDAQERAVRPITAGDTDVLIAAATAAGKTEAAFLPICSVLATAGAAAIPPRDPWTAHDPWAEPEKSPSTGVQVLYLSPLKALINDQYNRLEEICATVDVPVHRWHGDVAGSAKQDLLDDPSGVLLITPESLEAMFVLRGTRVPSIFAGLRYIVIDEMHSFLANPRGAQLQSLLHRTELALRLRCARIGLSATIGDLAEGAAFLRPEDPSHVAIISSTSEGRALQLQVRGYVAPPAASNTDDTPTHQQAIAEHLFRTLRGADNLVFANARRDVETYADILARTSDTERVPNEFWPHHGSLSKDARESVEALLKDPTRPTTAICTSTLEMGIDIGSVSSVAQIGPPPSVASLRQRLGRSGRRDDPSVIRMYVSEPDTDPRSDLVDELRCNVVQTIAMVRLMLDRWVESPDDPGFNYSTLVQQTLSTIAQHSGVVASDLHRALCSAGPFARVDSARYVRLLRSMAAADLIVQSSEGLLLPGGIGERLMSHYDFYAAFASGEEWRLVAEGRTLGSMPILQPLYDGVMLIFGGWRWRVTEVDQRSRVVELAPATGGKAPTFSGHAAMIGDRVREEMAKVYTDIDEPAWLDATAKELLRQGRTTWKRLGLGATSVLAGEATCAVLPWTGDKAMFTASLVLQRQGIEAQADGPVLVVDAVASDLRVSLDRILSAALPDAQELARLVKNKQIDKWDWVLDDGLSTEATAARRLDIDGAHRLLRLLAADLDVSTVPTTSAARRRSELRDQIFCVVDVETTGFSPRLGDRILEIAAVRMRGDGTVLDEWSTLVNPGRDVGPTRVHGITASDVLDAPVFADIIGDILERLDGSVLVCHNIRFDREFLAAEFAIAGLPFPEFPSLCTLSLGSLLQPGTSSRRLGACCERLGIDLTNAHDALADARAAARVLEAYIAIAHEQGERTLAAIGCEPLQWPVVPAVNASNARRARGHASVRIHGQGDYLAGLVRQLDTDRGAESDTSAYLELLDRALEDRRLTAQEAEALVDIARQWGLSSATIEAIHVTYYAALLAAARADGDVSDGEHADLHLVATLLGVDRGLQDRPDTDMAVVRDSGSPTVGSLAGQSVCFTGALTATVKGEPITRDLACQFARAAGLTVKEGVSRGLDILVAADPDSQSGKAKRAREIGTRVIAEAVFWRLIGISVD